MLATTSLKDAEIIPVSAITGKGIDQLHRAIADLVPKVTEKKPGGQFRMYIDRIFNVKGLGHVVTGSVLDGRIKMGSDLFLLPGKAKKVKVRGIQRHGEVVDKVLAGDRAALNLSSLKADDYKRGMVLCDQILEPTAMVDAWVNVFEPLAFIGIWSQVVFYSGTFESPAKIHLLDQDELVEGQAGLIQIHLLKEAVLENGDRFILRNSANDMSIGGGIILDNHPLHHRKRTPKVIQGLNDLLEASLHSDKLIHRIKIELNKINAPVFVKNLADTMHIKPDEIIDACETNSSDVSLFSHSENTVLIRKDRAQIYVDIILKTLAEFHQNNPILDQGINSGDFVGKLRFGNNEAGKIYLESCLNQLTEQNKLKKVDNTWVLASHKPQINKKTQTQLNWVLQYFADFGMDKPLMADLEKAAHEQGINKDRLKMMLIYLGQKNELIFHEGEYIHQSVFESCKNRLLQKICVKADGINEKEYRELANCTKKLAKLMLAKLMADGLIVMPSFYILITDKGKKEIEK